VGERSSSIRHHLFSQLLIAAASQPSGEIVLHAPSPSGCGQPLLHLTKCIGRKGRRGQNEVTRLLTENSLW